MWSGASNKTTKNQIYIFVTKQTQHTILNKYLQLKIRTVGQLNGKKICEQKIFSGKKKFLTGH